MNSCGFHRLAPPCGEGRNPRRCLNAKGRRRCCVGCERFFAIDAFVDFDVLTEFALCGAARRANAQRNRLAFPPFRSVNPIAPIGGGCWIPILYVRVGTRCLFDLYGGTRMVLVSALSPLRFVWSRRFAHKSTTSQCGRRWDSFGWLKQAALRRLRGRRAMALLDGDGVRILCRVPPPKSKRLVGGISWMVLTSSTSTSRKCSNCISSLSSLLLPGRRSRENLLRRLCRLRLARPLRYAQPITISPPRHFCPRGVGHEKPATNRRHRRSCFRRIHARRDKASEIDFR